MSLLRDGSVDPEIRKVPNLAALPSVGSEGDIFLVLDIDELREWDQGTASWVEPTSGGSSTFIGLTDTHASYTADTLIRANATANALEEAPATVNTATGRMDVPGGVTAGDPGGFRSTAIYTADSAVQMRFQSNSGAYGTFRFLGSTGAEIQLGTVSSRKVIGDASLYFSNTSGSNSLTGMYTTTTTADRFFFRSATDPGTSYWFLSLEDASATVLGGFMGGMKSAGSNTGALAIGLGLINPTAAAAGAQQNSGSIWLRSRGWKTDAPAASQTVDFYTQARPVQGAAAPTGAWWLSSAINNGALLDLISVDTSGLLTLESSTINYKQTLAADTGLATHINVPTGYAAAQSVWVLIEVNGISTVIPGWQ